MYLDCTLKLKYTLLCNGAFMKIWGTALLYITLCLFMTNVNAVSTLLINYEQLLKAVEKGDDVKAIIRLDRCQISDPDIRNQIAQNIDGASTRLNFTNYLHYKPRINGQLRDTIETSVTNFVEDSTGGIWTVHSHLNVFEDNTAILHFNLFDPVQHKSRYVVDWLCDISDGKDEDGLFLYNNP